MFSANFRKCCCRDACRSYDRDHRPNTAKLGIFTVYLAQSQARMETQGGPIEEWRPCRADDTWAENIVL